MVDMRYIFAFIIWISVHFAVAQSPNLVPNPDFEYYTELPKSTSEVFKLRDWFNPAGGEEVPPLKSTPDFLHQEGAGDARLPTPVWARGMEVTPYSGKAVAGIITHNKRNTREYLCVKLKQSLQKGKKYQVSFYYCQGKVRSLGAWATKIGVGFSKILPTQQSTEVVYTQARIVTADTVSSRDWAKFSQTYTAQDNYSYITIGNFSLDGEDAKKVFGLNDAIFQDWAYYFVDMVEVIELASPPKEEVKITQEEEKILERASYVQFKTGEAIILPESYQILDDVVELLNRYPVGKLSLEGHTDNVGTAEKNLALSQARADAIKAYFIAKNIKAERLATQGFGLTKPKETNETIEGRAKNRRVEMKFKATWKE